MYCAIIGDIVRSKDIDKRSDVQEKFNNILNKLNNKYASNIKSKLTITLGDEFQGLFYDMENTIDIINTLKMELYPVKLRFGIGIGDINTTIDENRPLGSDGPAYYAAREGIEYLKKLETGYEKHKQDTKIVNYKRENDYIELVNATLTLCYLIESKWTDKQRAVIREISNNDISQVEIARKMKIHKSNIQRSLTSSKYYNYMMAINSINKTLSTIWEDYIDV